MIRFLKRLTLVVTIPLAIFIIVLGPTASFLWWLATGEKRDFIPELFDKYCKLWEKS